MQKKTGNIDLVDIDDLHTWLHGEGFDDFLSTISEFLKSKPMVALPEDAGVNYPPYKRLNTIREKYSIYRAIQRTYEELSQREQSI